MPPHRVQYYKTKRRNLVGIGVSESRRYQDGREFLLTSLTCPNKFDNPDRPRSRVTASLGGNPHRGIDLRRGKGGEASARGRTAGGSGATDDGPVKASLVGWMARFCSGLWHCEKDLTNPNA